MNERVILIFLNIQPLKHADLKSNKSPLAVENET